MAQQTGWRDYLKRVHACIDPLIPRGALLALLDFPNHGNVGDSAIWLGELAYLRSFRPDCPIIWVSDLAMANWRSLPEFPAGTVILIHGGGNLGDLWSPHQMHRERVVAYYRKHRIIQLPQSIFFKHSANAARCAEVFRAHPDLFLLARDAESLEFAVELNDGRSELCPDMALCLPMYQRPRRPRYKCLALLRTDQESVLSDVSSMKARRSDIHIADWRQEEFTAVQRIDKWLCRYPRRLRRLRPYVYKRLARERVLRGSRMLSLGHVVMTDRLHAHILCTLMGIPHIVLDNNYRKIGRFRDVWTTGEGLCMAATTLPEAERILSDGLLFVLAGGGTRSGT